MTATVVGPPVVVGDGLDVVVAAGDVVVVGTVVAGGALVATMVVNDVVDVTTGDPGIVDTVITATPPA